MRLDCPSGQRLRARFTPILLLGVVALALGTPSLAQADDLQPSTVTATLPEGGTLTINKTVTVSAESGGSGEVDVFFLFDTSGSMSGESIDAAIAAANDILAGVDGMGDLAYGVGSYVDFPVLPYGSPGVDDPFFPTPPDEPFTLVQSFSSSATDTSNAISDLSSDLGFGADPEGSQLYALDQVAIDTGWREDSTKIIVWFGDAPAHDGDLDLNYPSDVGLDDAISALNAEEIIVEAFELGTLDGLGQATDITSATNGDLLLGVTDDNVDSVIDTIKEALGSAATYSEVSLEVVGDLDHTLVEITPSEITGAFDRSIERTFEFELKITGLSNGVDEFEVHGLVDDVVVAVETDKITVGAAVPEPHAAALFGLGSLLVGHSVRRRRARPDVRAR